MPVLLAGCKPDDISGMDLFDWAALALCSSATGGHDQGLPEWMGVPGGAGAGLECDAGAGNQRRVRSCEQRVDANGSGEPVRGAFG